MLSIITINFNNASGLRRTIDSLLSLRNEGFQWVFIDGGSTDGSLEIAQSFKVEGDELVSENDSGIYHAMNKGIKRSSGDVIMFLNSGDLLHDSIKTFNDIGVMDNSDLYLYGFMIRGKIRLPRINVWRFWSMPTSHQAILYSSRILRMYPFNETYKYAADFEHYLRINKLKLKIKKMMKPLIINEPYGSDQYLAQVLKEYRQALIENGYSPIWAQIIFWLKSKYLKIALRS